ncbi:MAG: hypothetical protein DMF68_17245 [Acidobacteria bacterium]|nr:MAG: hypothetical protein DMF68_17245 [Acidobacteriota bacterium]
MIVKYRIRFTCSVAAILLCLIATLAQAQQGSATTTARPTPTPASGNANSSTPQTKPLDIHVKASERAIDESIKDDPAVEAVIAPYAAKVRALDETIGKLSGELKKGGMGAGSLGNFVADALRNRAQAKLGKPVLLAVTNGGGLRKNQITEGDLKASDIYELLPFENALVSLDLTGEQLLRFLKIAVSHRDAQSGARITYRTNDKKENELVSVKFGDRDNEKEIDPNATYTIVTIDYLVERGGDYSMLKEAKNIHPLGLTMRDAVMDYVKAETAAGRTIKPTLDGRFRFDKSESKTEEPQ